MRFDHQHFTGKDCDIKCMFGLELFQAVLKQFYGGSDVVADEAEIQQHQKLEKLYISTRAAKVKKIRL